MLPPSGSRSGPRPSPRHRRSKRRFSSFLRRAHSRGRACRPSADAAGSRVDPGLSEKTRRPDPPARAGCAAHGLGSTGGCHRARTSVSIPRALSALVHYRMQHFTLQAEQHDKSLSGCQSAPLASRNASSARKLPANPARVPIMKTKARKPFPRYLSCTLDVSTCATNDSADLCHVSACAT